MTPHGPAIETFDTTGAILNEKPYMAIYSSPTNPFHPDAFLCPGTAAPGVPPAVCTAAEPIGLIANDQQIYTRTMPAS